MRIMPSGNGAFDWVPKQTGLNKTASNNDGEVQEEQNYRDDLLEAAKKVVAEYEELDGPEFGGDELAGDSEVAGDADAVEFEGDVNEVSEETEEADAVECLEEAKDAIERAVDCLDGGEGEEEFEAEVDLEVEDETVEGGMGCVTEDETDEEECDPECKEATSEEAEEEEVVEASANDWVKVAEISPKNRKKLVDYWGKQLGYPKDFVKLMVKDYEK